MAVDQDPLPSTTSPATVEVIDNEFPAYRAISPGAILSLILGVGAVFCFTDHWFLIVAVAAIVTGLLSIRKIRRLPDILTGAIFAHVGIALALVFGLASLTHEIASGFMTDMDASRFAKKFVDVIKDQPVNISLWWQQSPEFRKSKTPDDIADEIKKARSPMSQDMYREKTDSVVQMKKRLETQGEEIHFSKIESRAIDGLTVYANALLELHGPGSTAFPEKEQFALVEMMKNPGGKKDDWVVRNVQFPYKPKSTTVSIVKPVDDGHGHSH